MKIATSLLAAVLLTGTLGAMNTAKAQDGILSKEEANPEGYCHLKFPAIREDTLYTDHPVLKDPSDGDVIDFYGSCDEDPLGQHQVKVQRDQPDNLQGPRDLV